MNNKLREKLIEGKRGLGTMFHSGSGLMMEAIALSGMDFVVIDMEHAPVGVETTVDLIRASEARNMTPLVRISDLSRPSVLKLLDAGAMGLIAPAVESLGDVRQLIEYSKYPPVGNRGMAMGRAADFGVGAAPIPRHWEIHNEETMLIPMCETVGCLNHIDEIAAMEGVDGIFVGPCDLSISLGKPGCFDDPLVSGAFGRVARACRDSGKFAFIFVPTPEMAKEMYARGFHAVVHGTDIGIALSAYRKAVGAIQG